jgi:hypothetical protein
MNYVGAFLQLFVGIIIVYIMYRVSLWMIYRDVVVLDYTSPIKTEIFKGWVATTSFTNRTYNTFNAYSNNFRDLPRSINTVGGAQFSFTIWTRFNDPSVLNLANKVIFMYGDPTKYTVERVIDDKEKDIITDYIIKCPLLMFSADGNNLVIQFNTNENLNNNVLVNRTKSSDEAERHNIMAMLPGKWVMWTIVFTGNVNPEESNENGVRVEMYVNDFLHHTQVVKGSMRTNKGYLRILPEPITGGYLADFSYYNWALSQRDIKEILDEGMSQDMYNELDTDMSFLQPSYITEYNKLEIYNV